MLSGAVESELSIDGAPMIPRGEWASGLLHSDDDCDYLELQLCFSGSVRIDASAAPRAARHFAMMADAVIARQPNEVEYRMLLPVGRRREYEIPFVDPRVSITNPGRRSVFPSVWPQGRVQGTSREFSRIAKAIGGMTQGSRDCLHVPVVFDWHPRRPAPAGRLALAHGSRKMARPSEATAPQVRLPVIGKLSASHYAVFVPTDEARAVLGKSQRATRQLSGRSVEREVDPLVPWWRRSNCRAF